MQGAVYRAYVLIVIEQAWGLTGFDPCSMQLLSLEPTIVSNADINSLPLGYGEAAKTGRRPLACQPPESALAKNAITL